MHLPRRASHIRVSVVNRPFIFFYKVEFRKVQVDCVFLYFGEINRFHIIKDKILHRCVIFC